MRRIDRYLLSEMAIPALGGVMIMMMLLVGNVLYAILLRLYQARAPLHDILVVLLYSLPAVVMRAVPAALLLGTALSLNRLVREREMLAMRMSGNRLFRIILPYLMIGVFSSGVQFAMQEYVIPKTAKQANQMIFKLSMINPESLVSNDTLFRVDDKFIYVHDVDPKAHMLRGVVVLKPEANGWLTFGIIPVAENKDGRWYLHTDPVSKAVPRFYSFDQRSGDQWNIITPADPDSWLNLKSDLWSYMANPTQPDELTFKQLRDFQRNVRGSWSNIGGGMLLTPAQTTFYLHRKIAAPLEALVAILIAIPLVIRFGRSGGYVGLSLSMVVAFIFVVLQQWSAVLAVKSDPILNPVIAAWIANVFFGLLGLILLATGE